MQKLQGQAGVSAGSCVQRGVRRAFSRSNRDADELLAMWERDHSAVPADTGASGAVPRVLPAWPANSQRLIIPQLWENGPAAGSSCAAQVFLRPDSGVLLLNLPVGVAHKQGLQLPQQVVGAERLDQQ